MTQPPTGLIPYLVVRDADAAAKFYAAAFGAVEEFRMAMPNSTKLMHVRMTIGDVVFFFADDFPHYNNGKSMTPEALSGTPVTIHRYVPDVDTAFDQAVKAGATVRMPVTDMFWGDRYCLVIDPFGHSWSLATPIKK